RMAESAVVVAAQRLAADDARWPESARAAFATLGGAPVGASGGRPPGPITHAPNTTQGKVESVGIIGDPALLGTPALAFFCSTRCPGGVILGIFDLAATLRAAGVPVVSGFHSPLEQELLRLLLRGRQPILICPARSVDAMRIPQTWRPAIAAGRLAVVAPFAAQQRRPTAATVARRNACALALAGAVLFAHAAPGGKTERLALDTLAAATIPVFTLADPDNAPLVAAGAQAIRPNDIAPLLATLSAGRSA
ncbi:MAG: hypothetical protein ABI068_02045, partial [Ktedonobacterales bacterium]